MTLSDAPAASRFALRRPVFSPMFARLVWRTLVALGVLHLALQLLIIAPGLWNRTDPERDVIVYFEATKRLVSGTPVYQPWPHFSPAMKPSRFFYSPPFLLLTRPLGGLDFVLFARVWTLLMMGALWVYAACLARLAMRRWHFTGTLVFALLADIVCRGYVSVALGQAEPIMWMLFGLALTTRARAGWLALATLIKVHPLWSLGLALSSDRRGAPKSALAFALPALLASFLLVGAHNWAMWWPSTQPVASQGTFDPDNWSLSFAGIRLFHALGVLPGDAPLPAWARAYLSALALGGPLLTAFWARRRSRELRLCLVACAGAWCAPLCWTLYFPLVLLPLAVWLGERRAQGEHGA